jgi:hypothetical protein
VSRLALPHLIAAAILVALLGAVRLARSVRELRGRRRAGQVFIALYAVMLVAMTYLAPETMGVFALALVVSMFGEAHIRAWVAETLGAQPSVDQGQELLRRKGAVRYIGIAAIQPALLGTLGVVILALAPGLSSWEHWLGVGVVAGALLRFFAFALSIRRGVKLLHARGSGPAA